MFAITSEDPIDLVIVQGVLEVLVLRVVVKVVIKTGVIDSVYIDVVMGVRQGFPEERVMPLGISGVGRVKFL